MADLYYRIIEVHPDALLDEDFQLVDRGDGLGPQISFWNRQKLGDKPEIDSLPDGKIAKKKELEEKEAESLREVEVELLDTVDKLTRGEPASVPEKLKGRLNKRREIDTRRGGFGGGSGGN